MNNYNQKEENEILSIEDFKQEVLADYKMAVMSREASIIGRKEVLTGKAKFGIFGDGKELPQIVAAKFFKEGDFRSGYYRDQTFMFATGMSNIKEFFAQLYANPDENKEPASSGRQMNGHFSTTFIDNEGNHIDFTKTKNSSSDISPTAGQMVRGLGLAFASKLFRDEESLHQYTTLSHHGDEVCFVTIGDASTSEGHFWETINAAGVLQVPMAVFIWDDGYGISVPQKYQTTKSSISECLKGMHYTDGKGGLDIYTVKAWDYASLTEIFEEGIKRVREKHIPAIFHVQEVTQPQGHSTSGSQERYKSPERLEWEKEWDCLRKMKEFILTNGLSTEEEINAIEINAKEETKKLKQEAWIEYLNPIKNLIEEFASASQDLIYIGNEKSTVLAQNIVQLRTIKEPIRKDIVKIIFSTLLDFGDLPQAQKLKQFSKKLNLQNQKKYNDKLYSDTPKKISNVKEIKAVYNDEIILNGFEILNNYFDQKFSEDPRLIAFGEDLGKIGDVNQGFAGLQEKFGKNRIFDVGIREASIMGQGIGLALRGLRPIAEIQYLDYLLYGLQPLSDDVSSLFYRTNGKQSCPIIVRTRGHRLEGVWHSGSPLGMILNSLRGINICVPRNMTQAAGMYNTLLNSDEPGLVIECLNGYRLKEKLPSNIKDFTVPFGKIETLQEGTDITVVGYGSTLRIIQEAIDLYLQPKGISVELIDVQTLLPFDINHEILESIKKTSRLLIVDEDVSSGASAYIFNKIIEEQGAYQWLDAQPKTLSAQDHRPAYGTDGDYFSKPNAENITQIILEIIAE